MIFFQENLLGQKTWQRIAQLMQQSTQAPETARFQNDPNALQNQKR